MASSLLLALSALGTSVLAQSLISVSSSLPADAGDPVLESFVSYSLEFAFFPDYAGNTSHPNDFSANLLTNLGNLQGSKPYIRVGGNTQDYALYNASLAVATNGTINPAKSTDYPTTLYIGPSYFESYGVWKDVKYTHGFNLGLAGNNTADFENMLSTVPLACKALRGGKLLAWEYGNEPDLFSTSAQGPVRPKTWNEATYVAQWLNGTRAIKAALKKSCPDLLQNGSYGYIAPSFAGTANTLDPLRTWEDGLDADKDIKLISSHNYIGGATQPGVTLQGTLMNHTNIVKSISVQVNESTLLANYSIPFILGETNSLYNEGAPGLSNAFGAALWGVDFNLWSASVGIRRVHMHQGTSFRYQSWQPVETNTTSKGTKAPYYGNIAVAAILGDITKSDVQVANLPLEKSTEAAYATYADGELSKIVIIGLNEYNYTVNGTSTVINSAPRPTSTYSFSLGAEYEGKTVEIKRLSANGSDAVSGITWDGYSYNWELDNGKPVKLSNVTTGETAVVTNGSVSVGLPDSSVAVLEF